MKRKLIILGAVLLTLTAFPGCNHKIKLVRTDTDTELTVGDAVEMAGDTGGNMMDKLEAWFVRLFSGDVGTSSSEKWNEIKDKTGSDIIDDAAEKGESVTNSVIDALYDYITQDIDDSEPENSTPANEGESAEENEGEPAGESESSEVENTNSSKLGLEVQFLDVGQGDCVYIACGDDTMIIDTGDYNHKDKTVEYLTKQSIDQIDYLVLTHPDSDHIGSAGAIIRQFDIKNIFALDIERDTAAYTAFVNAAEDKNYTWSMPSIGYEYPFGDGYFYVIGPTDSHEDINDNSIVIKMIYGNTSYLFTGDAEEEEEMEMILMGHDLSADVIKIGHHGSKSSSSPEFLSCVEPQYAVISCGENNDYGHPHAATLNTLMNMGIKLFRTDDQGIIISYSDGENITWNVPPTDNWAPGN